jgi:hypothetical protein
MIDNSDGRLSAYSWVTRSTQIIAPAIGAAGTLIDGTHIIGITLDRYIFPSCVMVQ